MLTLNIHPICKARNIKAPFAFLTRNGFTHTTAHKIVAGKSPQPKLAYIEKLCILLRCQPNDLFQWIPADGQDTTLPLAALIPKQENGLEWMDDLSKLSLDKLRALGAVVKGEMEK